MNNIAIFITGEYEDKEGGQAHFEEKVTGDIFDIPVLEAKIDEAVGRLMYHIGSFRDREPLPDDEDENRCGKPHNNAEGEESCAECTAIRLNI